VLKETVNSYSTTQTLHCVRKKYYTVYFIKHNVGIKGFQMSYRSDGVSFGSHVHTM